MSLPKDPDRLRHMLDAARDAVSFVQGQTIDSLEADRMRRFALIHALEIIGEAAPRTTKETQDRYAQIPWKLVIGMRHRLAHGYYDTVLERIWETVQVHIPLLIAQLEPIVAELEP